MNVMFSSLGMLRANPAQHAFTATAPVGPNVLFASGKDVVSFGFNVRREPQETDRTGPVPKPNSPDRPK